MPHQANLFDELWLVPLREMTGRFEVCKNFSQLQTCCFRYALKIGVSAITYHHLPHIGSVDSSSYNVISLGFPADLTEKYINDHLNEADPSLRAILSNTQARWWKDVEYVDKLKPMEQAYLNSINIDEIGTGLTLPVFGPMGRNGFIALGFGKEKPSFDKTYLSIIQMICQLAHQRYCDLLLLDLPSHLRLSERESEILSWVVKGKSNSLIADILGIKETTVITYLQRSYDKLGVNNRLTAALRALASGELNL